jgi:glucokinase
MVLEPADRMPEPWLLGIEIGGTKLQLGIGLGQGRLVALERARVDPTRGAAGILAQIQGSFSTLLENAKLARGDIEAIGIGFGGPVEGSRGRTQRSYQISGWDDFPLTSWISEHLGVPLVVLENDADSAALAEARFGAGLGHSPLLYMTVGSGIGGALVINDQIYRGFGLGATEIGHLRVPYNEDPGTGLAELEQVASGWAIATAGRKIAERKIDLGDPDWVVLRESHGSVTGITAAMVARAATEGDPDSSSILERALCALAFACTQAIALLAPRRIVIGGGVSLLGERDFFDPIRRLINRDVFQPFRGQFDVVPATLGEEVVVHGALTLARDSVLATRISTAAS